MIIRVPLRDHPYDVHIGAGVRNLLANEISRVAPRARVAAVVTTTLLANQEWAAVTTGLPTDVITIPDGEAAKSIETVAVLCDRFAALGLSRHDVVVAVGGGATTDVVGFAAAVYLRGIAVIHVSTSIAGQVDAAIGGKTGINIAAGKNLVGSFHQPRAVFCDLDALATLPAREHRGGMGEVAKCWLLEGRPLEDLATQSLEDLIAFAVGLKARIVAADEFEETGERALLNYGHTFGHAIERLALARDLDALRHGEAVAIGLRFAVRLAAQCGLVDSDQVEVTDAVVDYFGLPSTLPFPMDIDELLVLMGRDKKAHHGLTFVLPTPTGFRLISDITADDIRTTYDAFLGGTQ